MARVRLAALVTAFGLLAAANCLADEPDHAEDLFRAGNRAFATGDYQAAFTHYREAWSLRKSFDIACNLGRTEAELGLSRDAAEHLDVCLRTFSVSSRNEVKDAKSRFRELFNRMRAKVGALEVEARPAGSEIAVDGIEYGATPLGRQLFVEPGRHSVRARLLGYQPQEVSVEVSAGGSAPVRFELAATPRASGAAAALAVPAGTQAAAAPPQTHAASAKVPATKPASGGMEPRTIVVLSGAALALVGLGIGVGYTLDANSANDRSAELAVGSASCTSADTSPACEELRSAYEQEDRSRDIASAAFLGSAIASAATIGLWLILPEFKVSQTTGFRVMPGISRSGEVGLAVAADY